MMAFILATDFDFIAYMSKMAFFGKLFSRQWRFWNMIYITGQKQPACSRRTVCEQEVKQIYLLLAPNQPMDVVLTTVTSKRANPIVPREAKFERRSCR